MGNFQDLIQTIIVGSIVFLIIMLILRELWCWYFKLNKMVALLTDIREALQNPGAWSPALNTASTTLNSEGLEEKEPTKKMSSKQKQEMYDNGECPSCAAEIESSSIRCSECGEKLFDYAQRAYKATKK